MNDDDINGIVKVMMIIMGLLLMMIIFLVIIIATHDTIVVNNYISSGNYTFDIGQNMINAINMTS